MNAYYSNLIEGHNTRPEISSARWPVNSTKDRRRRNLQLEAAAHVRVQAQIDALAAERPTARSPHRRTFIQWLHREFYRDAPDELLRVAGAGREFLMEPGAWRSRPEHDVAVGPSRAAVQCAHPGIHALLRGALLRLHNIGKSGRIISMATAHHRFNYIHPFPDGNGRVSRLMSHAMAHMAGIGAHGLWSISRRTRARS